MIPLKLQIKNFLSYGPETQTIDFTPYNLICLAGKNGHGKSAMLDAITWALWGQARKTTGTAKADEGLVHLGQKQMLIIFEFQIHETIYKIRREFIKTQSNPFAALDFGIMKSDNTLIALTDKTIKATQEKIETTIGISYDSFINSAFLRQGQANEFSKKSAKERKEILGTILQLDQFEDLKKIALEKTKTYQQNLLQKQNIQTRITQEIQELITATTDKQSCYEKIAETEKRQNDITKSIEFCEQKKLQLQKDHKKFELLSYQLKELEQKTKENLEQINILEKKYADIKAQQSINFDITTIQKEYTQTRQSITIHQEKLNKRLELKDLYFKIQEKKQLLEKEFDRATQAMQHEQNIAIKIIEEKITHQKTNIQTRSTYLQTTQQELALIEKTIADQIIVIEEAIQKKNILDTQEQLLPEQIKTLEQINAHIQILQDHLHDATKNQSAITQQNKPCCPLCQQTLSDNVQDHLEQKLTTSIISLNKEIKVKADQAKDLATSIQQKTAAASMNQKNREELDKARFHYTALQEKQEILQKSSAQQITELAILQKKLFELEQEYQQILNQNKKAQISSIFKEKENEYNQLIKNLEDIKQDGLSLGYDKTLHEQDSQKLQIIEKNLELYHTLQKEIVDQEQRLVSIEKLKLESEILQKNAQKISDQIKPFDTITTDLYTNDTHEKELKFTLQEILRIKTELMSKQAIMTVYENKITALQTEQMALTKEITSLSGEIIDFQEIAKALGKDGLQALLIEQAIPEIEEQANELLAQLTDNQTQIFIESLRDLKKGGSKETLDIKISDAVGLRPYEMFSGGEAFRIDFALRIAISKLLARRAGTALQTLIIDEGFGSQDDDGLQLIMDSILKIQDNFAKVIIVSHLPSMKEQFPVQFVVQKKSSGSTVTVVEQG
jgi:exonuclease SbcC